MEEINLKNKHESINNIFNEIVSILGYDYFDHYLENETNFVIDFWEDDLHALGLKKGDKVAYISTWDFRDLSIKEMRYYIELEIIDTESLEEVSKVKEITNLSEAELIDLLISFWNGNLS